MCPSIRSSEGYHCAFPPGPSFRKARYPATDAPIRRPTALSLLSPTTEASDTQSDNRTFPLKPNLRRSFFISDRPTPPSENIQQTSEEAGDGIA